MSEAILPRKIRVAIGRGAHPHADTRWIDLWLRADGDDENFFVYATPRKDDHEGETVYVYLRKEDCGI